MDPGEATPAGTRDAYCHEGGTVLQPRKDGTAGGPAEAEEARR
jgi:hypothetical protein